MTDDRHVMQLSVAAAARDIGVPVDTLRNMADAGAVPGTARGKNGHITLAADQLPTREQVRTWLHQRYRDRLELVRGVCDQMAKEIESVRLDATEAIEAIPRITGGGDRPYQELLLGTDLRALTGRGPLHEALSTLSMAALDVQLLHRHLLELELDIRAPW